MKNTSITLIVLSLFIYGQERKMSLGYNFYSEGQGTNYFININQWNLIESRNIRMDGILQLGLNSNSSELDYKSGFGQKVTFNNLIFLKIMAGDLGTEPKEQDIKFIPSYGLSYIPGDSPFEINLSKSQEYGYNLGFNYYFGAKPKKEMEIGESDGKTGSPEIDKFVVSVENLNSNIILIKEKLESVSSGLSKSNAVLTDIGNNASGPVGWAMMELQKGIAKSKNSIIASAQSLQSDVPDLPEIYFDLIKESLIAPQTLAELIKGTQPEDALLLTFNKKAEEKGIPTTSKDWIMGLNLDLDPTKTLRTKLGTIKDGVMGGKDKLASVPDDLKGIGDDAKALISSAEDLPKAAKKLSFFKAFSAIKVMKASLSTLKDIPNEVKSIGDETKKVIEEVDQVLKNIQSILSTS